MSYVTEKTKSEIYLQKYFFHNTIKYKLQWYCGLSDFTMSLHRRKGYFVKYSPGFERLFKVEHNNLEKCIKSFVARLRPLAKRKYKWKRRIISDFFDC